jgi:hypothetical protein
MSAAGGGRVDERKDEGAALAVRAALGLDQANLVPRVQQPPLPLQTHTCHHLAGAGEEKAGADGLLRGASSWPTRFRTYVIIHRGRVRGRSGVGAYRGADRVNGSPLGSAVSPRASRRHIPFGGGRSGSRASRSSCSPRRTPSHKGETTLFVSVQSVCVNRNATLGLPQMQ